MERIKYYTIECSTTIKMIRRTFQVIDIMSINGTFDFLISNATTSMKRFEGINSFKILKGNKNISVRPYKEYTERKYEEIISNLKVSDILPFCKMNESVFISLNNGLEEYLKTVRICLNIQNPIKTNILVLSSSNIYMDEDAKDIIETSLGEKLNFNSIDMYYISSNIATDNPPFINRGFLDNIVSNCYFDMILVDYYPFYEFFNINNTDNFKMLRMILKDDGMIILPNYPFKRTNLLKNVTSRSEKYSCYIK